MYRIGVDLGGTNIAVGVVDENMKIIGRGKVKTRAPRPAAEIFDDIALAVEMAVKDAGISMDDVSVVGVGTPGSVNKSNGNIEFSNNLEFNNVPAKEMLEERIGKTVFLDNDANCAALGEAIAGVGNGVGNFVAITLGTGVGSGIIVNGKIVVGVNYCAGEMGHMVICADGKPCNCRRKGCWEQYSSATALIAQTKEAMNNNPDSLMWKLAGGIDSVSGRTAFDAMRQGDKTAAEVVDRYIYYLSIGICNVINALQPEIVCIGGGISHEGDYLLKPLQKYVDEQRYSIYASKQTKIVAAQLGNDAGIFGAALLEE